MVLLSPDISRSAHPSNEGKTQRFLLALILSLTAAVFFWDLFTPKGVVVWLLYAPIMLLTLSMPSPWAPSILAGICTILISLAYALGPGPAPGVPHIVPIFNRALGVGMLWLITVVCLLHRRVDWARSEAEKRYRSLVESSPEAIFLCKADLITFINQAGVKLLGATSSNQVIGTSPYKLFFSESQGAVKERLRSLLDDDNAIEHFDQQIVRFDGIVTDVEVGAVSIADQGSAAIQVVMRDITETKRAESLLASEKAILEMVATGHSLAAVMEELCRRIEALGEGMLCAVLFLDPDGIHMHYVAAPSLPSSYVQDLDGFPIGPQAGSCGTAAFYRRQVVVSDIATDPLWTGYAEVALRNRLRACWSTPILAKDLRVLGTFAMFYHETRRPSPREANLIEHVVRLAGIVIERMQAETQLRRSAEQLRLLTEHLQAVREEERVRIARELHDELGQTLTAIKLELAWVASRFENPAKAWLPEQMVDRSREAIGLVDDSIAAVRRLVSELRPALLDHLDLVAALQWQAQEFTRRSGVSCDFSSGNVETSPDQDRTTAIFRVVQEALTNISRHAKATHVSILIREEDQTLLVTVEDNGIGMHGAQELGTRSFGLLGMRERVGQVGGTLSIRSSPGLGTTISVLLPSREGR